MGDNQGQAGVVLLADPLYLQQVRGAKVGRTVLQVGAGIAVPLSESSSVYTNVNADLRSGACQWDVNAGARLDA